MNDWRKSGSETSKPHHKKTYYTKEGQDSSVERQHRADDSGDKKFGPRNGRFRPTETRYPRNDRDSRSTDKGFQNNKKFQPKVKDLKPWERENAPRIVSDMQVTDGKYRGKYLQFGSSPKSRPTTRRLREVMFRILYRRIKAGRFLDLCAGCGTIGIEAISRGAAIGTFVERSAKMCSLIRKNIAALEIKEGHGELFEMEAVPFLKKMAKRKRMWDVVYYDPPYDADYDEVLDYFARGAVVKPQGVLVIEHHAEMFFPEKIGAMRRWRVVAQGETALSFFDRK